MKAWVGWVGLATLVVGSTALLVRRERKIRSHLKTLAASQMAAKTKEVEMATCREHFYKTAGQLNDLPIPPTTTAGDLLTFLSDARLLKPQKWFHAPTNLVGFVVPTRYGNVVVTHCLDSDADEFSRICPERLNSLLPELTGPNLKHYLSVGNAIETMLKEGT